jgi:hypothetical protein
MLRKITIGCAVVVAMLAAPAMSAHSMMGGMGGHSFGGMHSAGGMHSFGGPHMAGGWGGVHRFNRAAVFPRHHFARFHHFHHFVHFHNFHHFAHFRHRHLLFASAIGVGSCWRWVPTRWGWHRVWVCY